MNTPDSPDMALPTDSPPETPPRPSSRLLDPSQEIQEQLVDINTLLQDRLEDMHKARIEGMTQTIQAQNARVKRRLRQLAVFVRVLARAPNVSKACKRSGLPRKYVYRLRDVWPAFRDAWEAAIEEGFEGLEGEVMRRAKDGTLKPVFQKGELVGHIREFSDILAMFMLKGRYPERYQDRHRVDIRTGAVHYHIHGMQRGLTDNGPESAALPQPIPPGLPIPAETRDLHTDSESVKPPEEPEDSEKP